MSVVRNRVQLRLRSVFYETPAIFRDIRVLSSPKLHLITDKSQPAHVVS
ncbi:protein of unknown function [Denitratisoma oestradiolicum]|uniref:Uncharacterized protein n=1 Tax=Denitratisoma oestradiolicum TaxID=311182 RepID=A0A6S6XYC3_9PROT|nr:protein of unknown function [Denitratisoma oestradiolicum]